MTYVPMSVFAFAWSIVKIVLGCLGFMVLAGLFDRYCPGGRRDH